MIEQEKISEAPVERIKNFNPVTVTLTETTGILAMSVIAMVLLVALLRAQGRIRELQQQQGQEEE